MSETGILPHGNYVNNTPKGVVVVVVVVNATKDVATRVVRATK